MELIELLGWKGVLLALVVFVPLERLLALHDQPILRPKWTTDLTYALFNGLFIRAGLTVVVFAGVVGTSYLVPAPVKEWVGALPFWIQLPTIILISDLGFYFAHRLFHKVPWLWKFHAVHHSIEHLDWLAGHRVHPIDQIITKGCGFVPIFALGFSAGPLAVASLIYFWHSIMLHSNVKLNFGPLKWLIASPQFHHWHHANHVEAYDKNFAGQLSVLDIVFGTAHMPGNMPTRYGVDDPVPDGYLRQLAFPFMPRETTRADAIPKPHPAPAE
jgi:sterol desaturase/sphingolipid hydroxylase (fatty acid hydroxylase superfamily)